MPYSHRFKTESGGKGETRIILESLDTYYAEIKESPSKNNTFYHRVSIYIRRSGYKHSDIAHRPLYCDAEDCAREALINLYESQ